MIEIYPNLWVGTEQDYEFSVKGQSGWQVVHACKDPYHRQALGYVTRGAPSSHPEYLIARRPARLILNLVDAPDPAYISKEIIDAALDFIHLGLQDGQKVLVHCNLGESRSPSIGLLYLGTYTDKVSPEFLTAEQEFRQNYPKYNPKTGMRGFLLNNWNHYVVARSGK